MKKILTCLLASLGIMTSCSQSNYETDTFTTKSGKTLMLHALVHSSIRMYYDGKTIYIDPVTKLGDKTIDLAEMPKADYIFITHEHFDHLGKDAIELLTKDRPS
jgi:Predicted Zn-dependent hydrolases of the beta-lactamase fold